jgi:fused signal recognition particle receptor
MTRASLPLTTRAPMNQDTPLGRFRRGLARTRQLLDMPIGDLLRGQRPLAAEDVERVEEALLAADLGLDAVRATLSVLRQRSGEIASGGLPAMRELLRTEIRRLVTCSSDRTPERGRPHVVLVVGVNGVGKTTTIGKLAAVARREGRATLLCAADTFRAAAVEQLAIWAKRTGAGFHGGQPGNDPSAVLTDALRSARARGYDEVLVDTAGRLHTKNNLMAELSKMARVAAKEVPGAPHETLLVLDATVGSNGLAQGREFAQAVPLTGLVLTKLDGTAKGGIVVATVQALQIPVKYVGLGESEEDLVPFDADAFAASLIEA